MLIATAPYGGPPAVLRSSTAAAWAQAVGGIVAIGAAYSMGRAQMRAEDRRHARRLAAFETAARELLYQMHGNVKAGVEAMEQFTMPDLLPVLTQLQQQLRDTGAAAAAFPYYEIENLRLLRGLRVTTTRVLGLNGVLDSTIAAVQSQGQLPADILTMWQGECVAIEALVQEAV